LTEGPVGLEGVEATADDDDDDETISTADDVECRREEEGIEDTGADKETFDAGWRDDDEDFIDETLSSLPPTKVNVEEDMTIPALPLLVDIMLDRGKIGVDAIGAVAFAGVDRGVVELTDIAAIVLGGAGVFADIGVEGGRALDEGCNKEDALLLLCFAAVDVAAVGSKSDEDEEEGGTTFDDEMIFVAQSENDK